MSSLLKLNMPSRWTNYLRVQPAEGVNMRNVPSGLAVELHTRHAVLASGDKAGDSVEGTVIKPNQKVYLPLGVINPAKYHALLEVNPKFYLDGNVGVPRILEPNEEIELVVSFRADKTVDLEDMSWTVRIYMLD